MCDELSQTYSFSLLYGTVNAFLNAKRKTVSFLVQYGSRLKDNDEKRAKSSDGTVNSL